MGHVDCCRDSFRGSALRQQQRSPFRLLSKWARHSCLSTANSLMLHLVGYFSWATNEAGPMGPVRWASASAWALQAHQLELYRLQLLFSHVFFSDHWCSCWWAQPTHNVHLCLIRQDFPDSGPSHRGGDCPCGWRRCRRRWPCGYRGPQGIWWRAMAQDDCICKHLQLGTSVTVVVS